MSDPETDLQHAIQYLNFLSSEFNRDPNYEPRNSSEIVRDALPHLIPMLRVALKMVQQDIKTADTVIYGCKREVSLAQAINRAVDVDNEIDYAVPTTEYQTTEEEADL